MRTFYLGAHHPSWLPTSRVPLFLSATTLVRYRGRGNRWPVPGTGAAWAGDCGAYAALMLGTDREDHPWSQDPDSYGGMWLRICDDIGRPPDFIAVQDWPCEPAVRARTGFTVADHQEFTTDSYLWLVREFPWLPWLPVLQGWTVDDYVRHLAAYTAAGVDLTAAPLVGVGSICRRGSQRDVAAVLEALAGRALRLHAFGASINALRLASRHVVSSDRRPGPRRPAASGSAYPAAHTRGTAATAPATPRRTAMRSWPPRTPATRECGSRC